MDRVKLKNKVKSEFIVLLVLSVYFAIFFSAITYFRFAVLQSAEVPYTRFWLNIIKAIICAKCLLVSKSLYPIKVLNEKPLVWHILGRSLIYVLIVTILIAIEEAVVAKIRGEYIITAITGLAPGSVNLFCALEILYWLMLIPCITYSAISKALGNNRLNEMVFGKR